MLMKRFTTDHLTTFAAVIEYGTFDAAAESLRVSPSAISQRIKVMEQLAGKVLLRRTNPVTPTQAGQSVLRIARQSEFLQLELERELVGEGGFQTVSIALNADSLATWFLEAVRMLAHEDEIFCDLRREGEFHSSALLRSGEVMAAITSRPGKIPGCSVDYLGVARYWCVAAPEYMSRYLPGFPSATTREELNRAPVVEYDRKDFVQEAARILIEEDMKLPPSLEPEQSPTIYIPSSPDYARAVYEGVAWGLLPQAQCSEHFAANTLVKLSTKPVEFPLYWQHWNINSPVLETVSRRVAEAAKAGLLSS